jgi:ABC-type ATPase with predicted acetyltransferase domain
MPSTRSREVVSLFGLPRFRTSARPVAVPRQTVRRLIPDPGQITLIIGPSGSGKSTLLRAVESRLARRGVIINLDAQPIRDLAVVDLFPELSLEQTLRHVNRFGLAEAWTYLRRPSQLSAGQLWRLRLALAIYDAFRPARSSGALILCDEFTSLLDRITAAVIARALRKAIVPPVRAILATSHDDLLRALQPDILVECDFGGIASPVVRLRDQ